MKLRVCGRVANRFLNKVAKGKVQLEERPQAYTGGITRSSKKILRERVVSVSGTLIPARRTDDLVFKKSMQDLMSRGVRLTLPISALLAQDLLPKIGDPVVPLNCSFGS